MSSHKRGIIQNPNQELELESVLWIGLHPETERCSPNDSKHPIQLGDSKTGYVVEHIVVVVLKLWVP